MIFVYIIRSIRFIPNGKQILFWQSETTSFHRWTKIKALKDAQVEKKTSGSQDWTINTSKVSGSKFHYHIIRFTAVTTALPGTIIGNVFSRKIIFMSETDDVNRVVYLTYSCVAALLFFLDVIWFISPTSFGARLR